MSGHAHNPSTLLHIAAYLRQRGIPPVEIFRRAGIAPSALLNGIGWVPRNLCFKLGAQIAVVGGDSFPGAWVGSRFKLAELGTWGRAILAARNLRQACHVATAGLGLLHQGSKLRLVSFRRHAQLRFSYQGELGGDPRQHLIGTLAVLRKIALLGGVPEAVSVRFSMPYARHVDVLEESHGPRLEFGCAHDAVVIDRELLAHPLVAANGNGRSSAEPAETAEAIGMLVKRLLPYGHVTIDGVAQRLPISIRTLQRRLREWGFSFEEIVDDVRRTEATALVLAGEHSSMEIAFLLGYSDQAHFTRAFKRWTGLSPRNYERLHAHSAEISSAKAGALADD
jgi:AraC-like DNA-binding protein